MSKMLPILTCKGQVYSFVKKSRSGKTAGEIYRRFANYSQRNVRQGVSELVRDNMFRVSKCRCGHSPIYHAN